MENILSKEHLNKLEKNLKGLLNIPGITEEIEGYRQLQLKEIDYWKKVLSKKEAYNPPSYC